MTPEFQPWPKIARLNRNIIVTEKIDGTNAAVGVTPEGVVYAQSRTRIITPESDNFGFAKWVAENEDVLREALGPGIHYGEWWGSGIQRGYGIPSKCFSLFRAAVYEEAVYAAGLPSLDVVPVMYEGPFRKEAIALCLGSLAASGSWAAPGFMKPEGIVIYHTAAKVMFKVTLEKDEQPKGLDLKVK